MLVAGQRGPLALLIAAGAGNVLGSVVNWLLGRFALALADRHCFPLSPATLATAAARFRRYGLWSLLFAWLPVVDGYNLAYARPEAAVAALSTSTASISARFWPTEDHFLLYAQPTEVVDAIRSWMAARD